MENFKCIPKSTTSHSVEAELIQNLSHFADEICSKNFWSYIISCQSKPPLYDCTSYIEPCFDVEIIEVNENVFLFKVDSDAGSDNVKNFFELSGYWK